MALDTQDRLNYALANAQNKAHSKGSFTPRAVGAYHSLWKVAGNPGPGATPATGAGAIPDDTTAGAIPFVNGAGAENNYLLYASSTSLTLSTLYFYDRLWANSNIDDTTALHSFTSTALTRETSGIGVEVWLEIYVAHAAATASTLTVSYTNQAGTTGRTGTILKPAVTDIVNEMFGPMQLQSGDSGVRAIASTQWSVTQTSGDAGLTMIKRCGTVPLRPSDQGASVLGPFDLPYRQIPDAALATMVRAGSASANSIDGEFGIGTA